MAMMPGTAYSLSKVLIFFVPNSVGIAPVVISFIRRVGKTRLYQVLCQFQKKMVDCYLSTTSMSNLKGLKDGMEFPLPLVEYPSGE